MELDTSPLISRFQELFTTTFSEEVNSVINVYPTQKSVYIDYQTLEKVDPEIADLLIKSPDAVISAAEEAIKQLNLKVSIGGKFTPKVRFINVSQDVLIEQLGSVNLNEFVSFKCVITKRTEIMHKVKVAVYVCELCDAELKLKVGRNFKPPKKCSSCNKVALKQVDEKCIYSDIQRAEAQELLERIRGGAPAARIELLLEDDLVNNVSPGDNIIISGILRLKTPQKTRQKQDLIYSRYVEVNSVGKMKRDFEEIEITEEDKQKIFEIASDPNVVDNIVKSIAPSIYGHYEVKKAIALQLFGGTKGKRTSKDGMPIRDDIHILLIGDPGIAKSRFLQSVTEIAPKSIYVSGKSVSGAGLTVAAEKDDLGEGGWTLKAGALILASGGSVQVDEFDKIGDEDRASLHEAMETQTISVAKAGIVAKFRSKTAILAAANPKYGRFMLDRNLADQFDIPPTLLSRFDLIFPIVDVLDEEKDVLLADHILATHMQEHKTSDLVIDKDILRKYIAYARRHVNPKLTKEAAEKIRDYYVDMRMSGKRSDTVPITPRYLEGLVRLAEAHAKMRLSDVVELYDAEAAISLFNFVLSKILTDKATGKIDIDVLTTGIPKSKREKLSKVDIVLEIIKELMKEYDAAEKDKIIALAKENYDLPENEVVRYLKELQRAGEIYEKEQNVFKTV